MRRTLAAAILLSVVAGPASAGTLTLTLKAGAQTQTATVTLPDADIARIVRAQKDLLVARDVKPGQPAPAPLTDATMLQRIANEVVRSLARNTLGYERQQAARAAMKTVTPIASPQ